MLFNSYFIMKPKDRYKLNKTIALYEVMICPICGKCFVKRQYSQAFCSSKCKDKYHNSMGDRHKNKTSKISQNKAVKTINKSHTYINNSNDENYVFNSQFTVEKDKDYFIGR